MLLKVKAAFITLLWTMLAVVLVALVGFAIKTYGIQLLGVLALLLLGGGASLLIYAGYTSILDRLQREHRGQ